MRDGVALPPTTLDAAYEWERQYGGAHCGGRGWWTGRKGVVPPLDLCGKYFTCEVCKHTSPLHADRLKAHTVDGVSACSTWNPADDDPHLQWLCERSSQTAMYNIKGRPAGTPTRACRGCAGTGTRADRKENHRTKQNFCKWTLTAHERWVCGVERNVDLEGGRVTWTSEEPWYPEEAVRLYDGRGHLGPESMQEHDEGNVFPTGSGEYKNISRRPIGKGVELRVSPWGASHALPHTASL
jgi:hypothetical protein